MSKRTPKNSKLEYNTPVVLCGRSEIFESKKRRFVPKRGTFPTETITLVVRSLYPNLPQMGQKFYHGMLMPLHDSMPSFMNFRQVLDLPEFKNQVSQRFASNQQCPAL